MKYFLFGHAGLCARVISIEILLTIELPVNVVICLALISGLILLVQGWLAPVVTIVEV